LSKWAAWKSLAKNYRRSYCAILTIALTTALPPQTPAQQLCEAQATPPLSGIFLSPAPPGSFVYFANLQDGDSVMSPFKVVFGLTPTMALGRSGIEKSNTGHHHLLVDTILTSEEMTQPIRVDAQHIHFGKGQSETMLALQPGKHTLQLVLGDWAHTPFNPSVQSAVITISVLSKNVGKGNASASGSNTRLSAAASNAMPDR
jgi:hypothetical protein